ncbi:MAG: peptide deformylase [Candidatus Saccharimonadales bacterium]
MKTSTNTNPQTKLPKIVSKDDIISLPNQHLRQRSQKVGLITDQIKQLAADMETAVHDWDASRPHEVTVALAAIQIDQPLRVVIVRDDFDAKVPARYSTLINPEITKFEGPMDSDFEGCLSIKSVYGKVPRYSKVRVKALDINGKEIRYKAEGFLARVLQHEIDHTNGIVFVDHIKDDSEAFFELNKDGKLEPLDHDQDIKKNRILW